ncbi:hypothetical protein, partial [Thermococcus sp.]
MQSVLKEDYLNFSYKLVEYLKTRHHTEAPHISLLSPEYSVLPRLFGKHGTLLEFLDEEDIDDELIEILDPTRIRGHSTFGIKATFKNYHKDSSVEFRAQFYMRTAPGSHFKKVKLAARVLGEDKLKVTLDVLSEDGSSLLYSLPPIEVDIHDSQSVVIGFGTDNIIRKAAELIQRALYRGDGHIHVFSNREVEDALSTEISAEKKFEFLPCNRKKNRRACYSSKKYLAVQNFLLEFSKQEVGENIRLSFVLRYIGPALLEKDKRALIKLDGKYGIPTYVYYPGSERGRLDRWAISHLFEVDGELSWENTKKAWAWIKTSRDGRKFAGLYNLEPIGGLAVEPGEGNRILLRDWHVDIEEVYPVESADNSLEQSFNETKARIAEELSGNVDIDALSRALEIVQS